MRPTLGRRRRARRCRREPHQLDDAPCPGRPGRRPRDVQEGVGGPSSPVHRGQDGRGPDGKGRDVLQRVSRHVRLVPPRRVALGLLPAGPQRPPRQELPQPPPALLRLLHGRGPHGAQLRSRAQDHPQHVQRQPRPPHAQGDGAGLGGRPHRAGGALQAGPRRAELPGDAGPLRGLQRRRRRPSDEHGDDDAGLQRLRPDGRAQVQGLDPGVRRRLGGADRGQRRPGPHQHRPGRRDRRRVRRKVVRRRLRLGILGDRSPDGRGGPPALLPGQGPLRLRQRPAADGRPALRGPVEQDDRQGQLELQGRGRRGALPADARRPGVVRLPAGALLSGRPGDLLLVDGPRRSPTGAGRWLDRLPPGRGPGLPGCRAATRLRHAAREGAGDARRSNHAGHPHVRRSRTRSRPPWSRT